MLRRGVLALDEDGDGEVSLNDLESAGSRLWTLLDTWRHRAAALLQRPSSQFGLGVVAVFYGGHFRTAAVVMRSLEGGAVERLEEQWGTVVREYQRARARLDEAGVGGDFVVVPPRGVDSARLGQAVVVADPRNLIDGVHRLQTAIIAQVAMALNQNTARLSMGLELGRWIGEYLRSPLERWLMGPEPEEEEDTQREHRAWCRLGVDATLSTVGVAIAWMLRGWAALWTTCGLGAQLCVQACDTKLSLGLGSQAAFFETALAAVGFAYQARHGGAAPLPWLLWPVLAPPRLIESGLRCLA